MTKYKLNFTPIDKEEAYNFDEDKQILIFNPLTRLCKIEFNNKNSVIKSKHAYDKLKYFIVEVDILLEEGNEDERQMV